MSIQLLARLARSLGSAHTPVSVAGAVRASFAATKEVARVELTTNGRLLVADETGVHARIEAASLDASAALHRTVLSLDRGDRLVVWTRDDGVLPRELLDVAAAMIGATLSTCAVLARVGDVARVAHASQRELERVLGAVAEGPEIVARSSVMRRLLDVVVPAVATRDITVLLLGESGVGKELFARRIHSLSRRSRRAFVATNCGSLPESLVDSLLFGHEKGAFTGAHAVHRGIFERADRGTLMLDEIGELPLASQARLLRVLEERVVERLGSTRSLPVDVRIVAATHRDLGALAARGQFRTDLLHRLAIMPIVIPPLRSRLDDLDVLVPALLRRLAERHRLPVVLPSTRDLKSLRTHSWPGNVRELENVLARALLFGDGKLDVGGALKASLAASAAIPSLEAATREHIEAALGASNGKIHGPEGAAALLGLRPTTLQSKMRKLGFVRATRRRSRVE